MTTFKPVKEQFWHSPQGVAAVSCSPVPYGLGGVRLGFWLSDKLGHAWVGAWLGVLNYLFPRDEHCAKEHKAGTSSTGMLVNPVLTICARLT